MFAKSLQHETWGYLANLFPSTPDAHLATVTTSEGVFSVPFWILQDEWETAPYLSCQDREWMEPPTSCHPLMGGIGPREDARVRPGLVAPRFSHHGIPPPTHFSSAGVLVAVFPAWGEGKRDNPCRTFPAPCRAGLARPSHVLSPAVSCRERDGPLLAWHQPTCRWRSPH